jgi:hypothetical protein
MRGSANQSDTEFHRVRAEFHRADCFWRVAPEAGRSAKAPRVKRHLPSLRNLRDHAPFVLTQPRLDARSVLYRGQVSRQDVNGDTRIVTQPRGNGIHAVLVARHLDQIAVTPGQQSA